MRLDLSGGRKVIMSVGVVHADDEYIAIADNPDLIEQAAREKPDEEASADLVDRIAGLKPTPVAVMTITREDGAAESVVQMSRNDLRRHIVACRAMYDAMEETARVADTQWAKYREHVRREAKKQ